VIAMMLVLAVAAGLRLTHLPELPLGIHYDEAANVILAGEIAHGDKLPIFIPSYTGKEALFFYWAAAWMRVLGQGILALRLTAALAGICTVAAAAWAAYELVHDRRDAPWVGVLTAAFLATALWHVILNHIGFRVNTQPLLQALTVAALWRGLRLERRGWLILAGLLCGATLYTYLAARAFPLVLAMALLTLIVTDRGHRRARLAQSALFVGAAVVVFAPLAAYFVAHPAALTTRMGQVAPTSWSQAWTGLRACLGMFFLRGDPYVRFNIPGRPLLDPATAALALAGLSLIAYRGSHIARRISPIAHSPSRRSAPCAVRYAIRDMRCAFLLTNLLVMLLPSALAVGEITPSNLRVVGLLPFLYIFPAVAVAELVRYVTGRGPRRLAAIGYPLAVALLLLVSTPLTAAAYLGWATSPAEYVAADGDLVDAAAYLNQSDLSNVTPYVAAIHYRHPTLALLTKGYSALRWVTGGETLVAPAAGEGLLLLPRSADAGRGWMEARGLALLAAPPAPDGQPAFHAYRVRAGMPLTPTYPLDTNFGGAARLLGYDLLDTPRSGGQVDVVLYWQVLARPQPGDLLPSVQLRDPWGGVWGESRPFHYPAEQWTPGEVVLDHIAVPVAWGAPPGEYRLRLEFYAASTDTRLPALDPSGAFAGVGVEWPVTLDRAAVPPDPASLPIRQPLDLAAGPGLTLLGADLGTTSARPGERVYVTLFWRAGDAPLAGRTVHLSLGGETLYEGPPVHGSYPTGRWAAGEVVADRYDPRLGRATPAGSYPLLLTLLDGGGQPLLGPLDLGEVAVAETERTFEPPQMTHPVAVSMGEQVRLLGYDLEPLVPGRPATLTLYWQALTEMETSYTVFAHLLRPDGTMAAQHDSVPAGGAYPTTLWVSGEVVADRHVLDLPDLPAGVYTLEVGMYVAETGMRLAVPDAPGGALVLEGISLGGE
jgi:hypothetical protein